MIGKRNKYGYWGKHYIFDDIPRQIWIGPMSREEMLLNFTEFRHEFRPKMEEKEFIQKIEKLYSSAEVAELTGLSQQRIGHFTEKLIESGYALKVGKLTIYTEKAIEWIQNKPDMRGKWKRPKRNKK